MKVVGLVSVVYCISYHVDSVFINGQIAAYFSKRYVEAYRYWFFSRYSLAYILWLYKICQCIGGLVCFSAVGFFTALVEPILLRVRIKWIEVLLGVNGDRGIYMIFHFNPEYKTGIILGFICALLMAFVMIYIVNLYSESIRKLYNLPA